MFYYLSIGSNIDSKNNAIEIVRRLSQLFGPIVLYPFRYTRPENVESPVDFLNTIAVVYGCDGPEGTKEKLNRLEEGLGRDRTDPNRSVKPRTADLDILYFSQEYQAEYFARIDIAYVRCCYELHGTQPTLAHKGLNAQQRAAAINLDASTGEIVITEDILNGFVNRVKPSFKP